MKRRKSGEPASALAAEFGVSEKSVKRWFDAYKERGKKGLDNKSTKPKKSPNKISKNMERMVLEFKEKHTEWRPATIAKELKMQGFSISHPKVKDILIKHKKHAIWGKKGNKEWFQWLTKPEA
ncbi:helix-turn-helix domain-containing protein [Pseudoalteromonas xiamenensis]|nr:helix-turn-helix domain-containing protein [Pseudoalteromonas xiamenensis]WMN60796.1 helix-turn-helix domain-containing protein [Pseudoalteromonas xiamenensis]WMN60805.1 helix-turn-helix domain-containing protein [Pseudoalteromonas xiamenensis]